MMLLDITIGLVLALAVGAPESPQPLIETVAGTGQADEIGDGGAAVRAITAARGLAFDSHGDLYLAEPWTNRVRRIDHETGIIRTVAGRGQTLTSTDPSYGGDGGPATQAYLKGPEAVAVAPDGSVVIADTGNGRIRRVDTRTGSISTLANGLSAPVEIAFGRNGELFVVEERAHRIVRLESTGTSVSFAGTGKEGNSGDGGPASGARLKGPTSIALAPNGDVFIADTGNNRIRRVDSRTGVITTIAGAGGGGDEGPALQASFQWPTGLSVSADGSLFLADTGNDAIRRIDLKDGTIHHFARGGLQNLASDVWKPMPYHVGTAVDPGGCLVFLDGFGRLVVAVDPATGGSTTLAGRTDGPFASRPRSEVSILRPGGIAVDESSGILWVADPGDRLRVVRRISLTDGSAGVLKVLGDPDVVPGTIPFPKRFKDPEALALDGDGSLYVADSEACRIWRIDRESHLTVFAGDGTTRPRPDGTNATTTGLCPNALALDASGNMYGTDERNGTAFRIDRSSGSVTTLASRLKHPQGISVSADGEVFVSEAAAHRVVRLDRGDARVVAGSGQAGLDGDGAPATKARLLLPSALAFDLAGGLLVADSGNDRVRRVDLEKGTIETVVGGGRDVRDAVTARETRLDDPRSLWVTPAGDLYIGEAGGRRIRRIPRFSPRASP